jgi:signal transduction histidine kinase
MLNIVSNACKFTAKGEIETKAQVKNDEVHMSVRDTGPGIPEEDRDEVFAAFKQTKTGLRQGGGTGLGMPISRNLVEAHEGKLWFESVVDQGTTFFVTLPVKSKNLVPTL